MKRKKRVRRLRIDNGYCQATPTWTNPTLRFSEYGPAGMTKEVIVTVRSPYEARAIKVRVDEILDYWRKQLL